MEERISKYWEGKMNQSEIKQLLYDLEDQADEPSVENLEAFIAIADHVAKEANTPSREHVLRVLHRRMAQDLVEERKRPAIKKLSILKIVAAVVAVLFGVGLIRNIHAPESQDYISISGQQSKDFIKENTTDKAIALHLPDTSVVLLYPGSRIQWVVQSEKNKRIVHLQGKARFDVKKDTNRPFSVYNNGYVTTALGTSFTVDDQHGSAVSTVALLSGKVVVKAEEKAAYQIGEVYLIPGEQLDVRISEKRFAVSKMVEEKSKQEQYVRAKQKQEQRTVSSLTFEKETLDNVFESIGTYSGKEISFERSEMTGLTFTGDLVKLKSVERMLQVVCGPNGLQYKKQDNCFIIIVK